MRKIIPLLVFTGALALMSLLGCSSVQSGVDPLVVRTEQAETVGRSTFKFVLLVDNSGRSYFRTNTPAFHNLCEWLREPVTYPPNNTNGFSLPRNLAFVLSLDDLKLSYQSSLATSNDLFTALNTFSAFVAQAQSWQPFITNSPFNPR